jgi:hypothetical protein
MQAPVPFDNGGRNVGLVPVPRLAFCSDFFFLSPDPAGFAPDTTRPWSHAVDFVQRQSSGFAFCGKGAANFAAAGHGDITRFDLVPRNEHLDNA